MQKVIIADDEEKVCQLIEKLINWKELDMQVVAVAHNGIEAHKEVLEKLPDIVITDICMPGMDGLKMIREIKKVHPNVKIIIISGYRHFEYAQNALKYGVNDYLLKPIKKAELTGTLKKMREEYLQRTEQLTFEEKYLLSKKNDVEKLRTGFFSNLLYPKKGVRREELLPESANRDYYFQFQEGTFQIVCIKLDGIEAEEDRSLSFMADKVRSSVRANLKDCCYDMEIYMESSRIYCLLNYSSEKKKVIRKALKIVLNEILLMESLLQGLQVTIGCGTCVESLDKVWNSMQVSLRAVEQRLLTGTKKLIEESDLCSGNEGREGETEYRLADTELFREFNRNMISALERLDEKQVSEEIDRLKEGLLMQKQITGHEILQMTKEVCNLYLLFMRQQNLFFSDGEFFLEKFNMEADSFYTADDLFEHLKQKILVSFRRAAEEKRLADNRPVRLAKKYIQENFAHPLTLEEISEVAGFNATYFSSFFKKETGQSYSEYLFEVRMEQAKKFLRESNDTIAEICRMVGYSDVKYFTKSFIKYSGLKPKEYRKIYS